MQSPTREISGGIIPDEISRNNVKLALGILAPYCNVTNSWSKGAQNISTLHAIPDDDSLERNIKGHFSKGFSTDAAQAFEWSRKML